VLTLTDQAARAIRSLTANAEHADEAGLRIVTQNPDPAGDGDAGGHFAAAVSEGPAAGDKVVEDKAVRVYLEPGAARMLNDRRLDARITEHGDVQFLIQAKS
jgi:Fe-S cluster assembly iron-binding protein IscA